MVLLPHLLSGMAIPSMASLMSQDSSKANKASASGKNAFADIMKSELNNQASGTSNVNATSKLQERLKTLAAEINRTADAERAKESMTASLVGAANAGNMLSTMKQANNTVKEDSAQIQKLVKTDTTPTAQMPSADGHTKISGENPSLVLVTAQDQANNAGFNRYRMESLAMNKKGLTGSNVMVGLRIPIG